MRTLETIALRCCGGGAKNGRASVQNALLPPTHCHQSDFSEAENVGPGKELFTTGMPDGRDVLRASADRSDGDPTKNGDCDHNKAIVERVEERRNYTRRQGRVVDQAGAVKIFSRGRGEDAGRTGAIAFSLRVADSYSRDDSRTIVRRAGAARVAATAFGLLRALLTAESRGAGGERRWGQDDGNEEDTGKEEEENGEELALARCVDEFHEEQVRHLENGCLYSCCDGLVVHGNRHRVRTRTLLQSVLVMILLLLPGTSQCLYVVLQLTVEVFHLRGAAE